MTGRERLIATLNHQQPDRTVIDLGGTSQTGINASTLYRSEKLWGFLRNPLKSRSRASCWAK